MFLRAIRWTLVISVSLALGACETKDKPQPKPPADKGKQPPVDMAVSAEAARILDSAITAHGGLAKLKRVTAWTASSKGTYMGMPYEATSTYHQGEVRMDITMHDGGRMAMVHGERNCWMRTGPVVNSCPEQERKAQREFSIYERTAQLWPLKEGDWKLAGGKTAIDGKPHPSLTISKPGLGGEGKLVFDPETHLLERAVFPGEMYGRKGTYVIDVSHYHTDCGVKMARDTVVSFEGNKVVEEKYGEFHCGPVDPDLFIEPLQVANGTTLEKTAGASTLACHTVKGEFSKIGASIPKLMGFIGRKKLTPMGAPIMIYLKAPPAAKTPEEYLTEVCLPVAAKAPAEPAKEGDFTIKGLAPTKVLAMYGLGDYSKKSGELARKLMGELARRKLKATGAMRQVTHHNPMQTPAEKLVSEMQIPIE